MCAYVCVCRTEELPGTPPAVSASEVTEGNGQTPEDSDSEEDVPLALVVRNRKNKGKKRATSADLAASPEPPSPDDKDTGSFMQDARSSAPTASPLDSSDGTAALLNLCNEDGTATNARELLRQQQALYASLAHDNVLTRTASSLSSLSSLTWTSSSSSLNNAPGPTRSNGTGVASGSRIRDGTTAAASPAEVSFFPFDHLYAHLAD